MNDSRRLRWGILGTAKIIQRLLPSFRTARTADLQAIASRSLETAQAAASRDGIPVAHGSYETLLADPNIDAVYIPLPNTLHAEWTMKAADAGKHILCEKPLAADADTARKMVAHCALRGVRLMDGFMWPHHPRTHHIRTAIDSGAIGNVVRAVGAFTFPMEDLNSPNIRLQTGLGGGSLLDVGCYPVFGIRWAFGAEPVEVVARSRTVHGVDVEMAGILTFANGSTATFDCGFTMPLRMSFEIVGTLGTIHIPKMWLPDRDGTYIIERDDSSITHHVPGYDQIACMLDDFAEAVFAGRDPLPHASEATRTLRVLDALAASAEQGSRPIAVRSTEE